MEQSGIDKVSNTKHKKPCQKYRKYVFTLNNYSRDDIDGICWALKEAKYLFQEEMGESGTPHLQGYIEFENPRSWKATKKINNKWHLEICTNSEAAKKYCTKEESRFGDIYTNIKEDTIFYTKKFEELYEWQKSVLKIISEKPNDRSINWFYEYEGCTGKTTLAKYILKHYPFATYSCASKSADILSIADPNKNIYILNFARTQEGFAPYTALEQLKDGLISDSKLKKKSNNIIMNPPHIVVFANWPPDQSKLSADRWNVVNIKHLGDQAINNVPNSEY